MSEAFDTNVLVYACDKRDPGRQQAARGLIERLPDGVLLWQVACEFLAASRKLRDQGFTPEQAWNRLVDLTAVLPLILPNLEVLDRARRLHAEHGCAFWDAMIFAACVVADVRTIYSEDLPGCCIPGLQIVNPFATA